MIMKFCTLIVLSLFSMSAVFAQSFSQDVEKRLLSFCELYSTVKYYYPDPNLQDFPWDAFAYQGYKIATIAKNDKEFIQRMDSLFCIISPGIQISKKNFNVAHITPNDTSLYSERAFWQHQGGLNIDKPSSKNGATLNYIYQKTKNNYGVWMCLPSSVEKYNKKMRLSLWIKTENMTDSAAFHVTAVASRMYKNRSPKDDRYFTIKALNTKWEQYFIEFIPDDSVIVNQFCFSITHPLKGTIYIDDLKMDVYNGNFWEPILVPNGNFEQYDDMGKFRFWTESYAGGLAVADSTHAIEGKYCLKLPAIQEQTLYSPQSFDKPYSIPLGVGYSAHIPLRLYANEKSVFPITDTTKIKRFEKSIKAEYDDLSLNQQAIIWCIQIWTALYQDYPYRNIDFKQKINSLLIHTINKLLEEGYKNVMNIPYHEFLVWINDPHARIWFEKFPKKINSKTLIKVPISDIELTEKQCIVKNVSDTSVVMVQRGDIILQIDNINIDSLLQIYKNHNISRNLQEASIYKMLTSTGKPKLTMMVQRGCEIISLEFTTKTNVGYANIKKLVSQLDKKSEADVLCNSLKKKNLFYIDCESYNHQAFSTPLFLPQQEVARITALNSLIMEINEYDALILDARGDRGDRTMSLLHTLNECYGIDINKKRYITKIAFSPVAQFQKDTTNLSLEEKREIAITVPIYVLVGLHTQSAPEIALLNLKQSGKATFIGSNTSGAAGYTCSIQIADGLFLSYTTGQVVGLNDNPMSYQGTGIPPDIYVYPTAQGIAEGRDEVLEKAIEIVLENIEKEKKE